MQMVAQAFPQLKADATYQKLMQQLETLENDILARRENYNNRVNAYNSYRNSLPVVLKDKLDSAKPKQPNGDEPQDKEQ